MTIVGFSTTSSVTIQTGTSSISRLPFPHPSSRVPFPCTWSLFLCLHHLFDQMVGWPYHFSCGKLYLLFAKNHFINNVCNMCLVAKLHALSPNNLLEDGHITHICNTSVFCLFPIVPIVVVLLILLILCFVSFLFCLLCNGNAMLVSSDYSVMVNKMLQKVSNDVHLKDIIMSKIVLEAFPWLVNISPSGFWSQTFFPRVFPVFICRLFYHIIKQKCSSSPWLGLAIC